MATFAKGSDYTKYFSQAMFAHSEALTANPNAVVFTTDMDGGLTAAKWLEAMAEISPDERSAWQCNHCLKLMEFYGSAIVVTMDDDFNLSVEPYMWPVLPVVEDPETEAAYSFYRAASEKMRAWVMDPKEVFKRSLFDYRTDKRTSSLISREDASGVIGRPESGGFHHFHVKLPKIHSRNFQPMSMHRLYEDFVVNFKKNGDFDKTFSLLEGIVAGSKEAHSLFEEQLRALKGYLLPFFNGNAGGQAELALRGKYLCHNRHFMNLANSLVAETLLILSGRGDVPLQTAVRRATDFFESKAKATAYKRSSETRGIAEIQKTFEFLKANGYEKSLNRRYALESDLDRYTLLWRQSGSKDDTKGSDEIASPLDALFNDKLKTDEKDDVVKLSGKTKKSLDWLCATLAEGGVSRVRLSPQHPIATVTMPSYADAKPAYKNETGACTVAWADKHTPAAAAQCSGNVVAVSKGFLNEERVTFFLSNDLGGGQLSALPGCRSAIIFPTHLVPELFAHRAVIEQVTREKELDNVTPGFKLLAYTTTKGNAFPVYITRDGIETCYEIHCFD